MWNRERTNKERFEDLKNWGKWVRRKVGDLVRGRPYTFDFQDFHDILGTVNFLNWISPKITGLKGYQKHVERKIWGAPGDTMVQTKIVPLNAKVKGGPGSVVPYQLMDQLMEKTSCRVIMHKCLCRTAMKCEHYPRDLGCLNVGEGARILAERGLAREVGVEEAKEHLRKVEKAGLVVLAAHVEPEELVMGIERKNIHKFLEFCFCCPCCCLGLRNMRYFSAQTRQLFSSIGFVAKALPTCKGCLDCVDICPMDAIKVKGEKVWVKEDDCVGCGLCQTACPHHAIRLIQVGPARGELMDYFDGLHLDLT